MIYPSPPAPHLPLSEGSHENGLGLAYLNMDLGAGDVASIGEHTARASSYFNSRPGVWDEIMVSPWIAAFFIRRETQSEAHCIRAIEVGTEALQALALDGSLPVLCGKDASYAQKLMLKLLVSFEEGNNCVTSVTGFLRVIGAGGVSWGPSVLGNATQPLACFTLRSCATINAHVRKVGWRALTHQCKAAYNEVDDGPGRQQWETLIMAYCDSLEEAVRSDYSTSAIWHAAMSLQMIRHAIDGPTGSAGIFNTDSPPSNQLAARLVSILGLVTSEV